MTHPVKLVIFDLDGTLVDAYKAIEISFNFTMRKLNLKLQPPLVIRRAVGRGDEALLQPFVPKELREKALDIYRRHHSRALLKYSKLFPATIKVLRKLKQKGYRLAVASNRPSKFSLILIKHLKIFRYFDIVLCADRIKNLKPNPGILLMIMKKLSCLPAQTLYVGDMAIDIQTGRRAKVGMIAVLSGSSTRDEIIKESPWRIIKDISKLPGLIKVKR